MSVYTPDRWVVLELSNDKQFARKVFAGWRGGYLDGDSWKLNSGITETRDTGEWFEFDGYSGSTYRCHKEFYGMTSYQQSILANWITKAEGTSTKIRIIDLEDITVS